MTTTIPESSKPNLEFTKINPFISFFTPPNTSKPTKKDEPTTILFCSWMGASPRSRSLHAAYHEHHTLFPSARILVIRSLPEWFMTTPTSKRRKLIEPAISLIESDPAPENQRKILVHLFSNGGGVSFNDICLLYKEHIGKVLPVKAMILDSSPGDPNLKEAWTAMSVGLPNGFSWYTAAMAIWAWLAYIWVYTWVLKRETLIDEMRDGLNEWDVTDRGARRLYVYSKVDRLVGWRGVEKHVAVTREKGVNVDVLREEDTAHLQHMSKDPIRYWQKVKEFD